MIIIDNQKLLNQRYLIVTVSVQHWKGSSCACISSHKSKHVYMNVIHYFYMNITNHGMGYYIEVLIVYHNKLTGPKS